MISFVVMYPGKYHMNDGQIGSEVSVLPLPIGKFHMIHALEDIELLQLTYQYNKFILKLSA
jgi:hypothetical protein